MIVELPEEGELVVAVIKKIMPYGAFCQLPEYENLEAFLHISEVAPRWIKNIHEFISEGQRHVVKVHHVDRQKNQVDVSIKRVSDEQKRAKLEQMRNEKKGAKLLERAIAAAKIKADPEKTRTEIESHFDDVYTCFREASLSGNNLEDLDIPKALKTQIIELAKKSIKKPIITVDREFSIVCYGGKGLETLKKALKAEDGAKINYLGAPRYKISLTAPDYKTGEKKLDKILENIKAFAQKNNCDFNSERR